MRALHPTLARLRDWQLVFFTIGAPGLLLAMLLTGTVREPFRRERLTPLSGFSLGPLSTLVGENRRAYGSLVVAAVLNMLVVNAQFGWLPTLFVRVHHWKPKDVGAAMGLVGLPCGVSSWEPVFS